MKLLILRENLKQVVGIVDRAVSNSSSLPVLRNILVIAANGTISVSATNLELAVTATLTGKITEEGSLTIPAHVFSAIVGSVSSEKIHLEKKGNSVLVKTDNYEAAIQTIHEKEFPIIPKAKNTREFIDIDGNLLRSAFDQVINAAATVSDFRQELSGVLFSFQGDSIICAATDSFRLAEKTISHAQYQTNIEKGFTVIIPAKNVQELIKILPSGTVRIHVDQNEIIFKNEEREIVSRLIEGKFPDYRNIIPTSFDFNAHVPINELLEGHMRLTITRGVGKVGLDPRNSKHASVIAMAYPFPHTLGEKSVRLLTSSIRRKGADSVDAKVKASNYMENILAKLQANLNGMDDALMLDRNGYVAEATATNVFVLRKGTWSTPTPVACLEGVTRHIAMEILKQMGSPVEERNLTPHELYVAQEVFLTGTGAGIVPVESVDGRRIGETAPGEATREVIRRFRSLTEEGTPIEARSGKRG